MGALGGGRTGTADCSIRYLRYALRETSRAIADLEVVMPLDSEFSATVKQIGAALQRPPIIVIFGRTNAARVRLLNALMGSRIIDEKSVPDEMRWVRIQYGKQMQVRLTLGNSEFELVEELEWNKNPWNVIPSEDLKRKSELDLSAILEIEMSNQFLNRGVKIILPPDLPSNHNCTSIQELKLQYADLYSKRDAILRTYNHAFIYAIDSTGKNIFEESFCDSKCSVLKTEDFWSKYNFNYMTGSLNEVGDQRCDKLGEVSSIGCMSNFTCDKYVFDIKNCLDLHQVKELHPNAQILFLLLSDSQAIIGEGGQVEVACGQELPNSEQATSSMEQGIQDEKKLYNKQISFIKNLMQQWNVITPPNNIKVIIKTQCLILDDESTLATNYEHPTNQTHARRPKIKNAVEKATKRKVFLNKIMKFSSDCLESLKLEYCTQLSEVQVKILQHLMLATFDIARQLQIVPKKIQYVASLEQSLYEALYEKFAQGEKKRELLQLMQDVLHEMKEEIDNMDWSVDDLPLHQDKEFLASVSTCLNNGPEASLSLNTNSSSLGPDELRPLSESNRLDSGVAEMSGRTLTPSVHDERNSDAEDAMSYDKYYLDDYEIIEGVEESIIAAEILREYYERQRSGDTLTRSNVANESSNELRTNSACSQMSLKQATQDVRKTVLSKLSRKISDKLQRFVDCVEEHRFGTLKRCITSLEEKAGENVQGARAAVLQLVTAPLRVSLGYDHPPRSIIENICLAIAELFNRVPWSRPPASDCCSHSASWRRHTANATLKGMSPMCLAKTIAHQILERLNEAHQMYQSSLSTLKTVLTIQLLDTEEIRVNIRKTYAPNFARLCLESTSMCDVLMYGIPDLGKELGRGQYGVVYTVRGLWGSKGSREGEALRGLSGAAAKSLLPLDSMHYKDLAMEFFYARCIPEHPNIVPLLGSIVMSDGAGGPMVLLMTPRYKRDLHLAVRCGLTPYHRACVAIDVATGLRYLHSLGLVHRDVKLKNVLLCETGTSAPRAALSDFGFCAAATLCCGSVVGTPVHMAPELLSGDCSGTVDVYALGIMLWYLCAGTVKLPGNFEAFRNKEQLWSKVRKGVRPEKLDCFSDICWQLMQACWQHEPSERPLLGNILETLERVKDYTLEDSSTTGKGIRNNGLYDVKDDSSSLSEQDTL